MTLRPYQEQLIADVRAAYAAERPRAEIELRRVG